MEFANPLLAKSTSKGKLEKKWLSWLSEALARPQLSPFAPQLSPFAPQLSPFAPQKCVNEAHFRGAKGNNT